MHQKLGLHLRQRKSFVVLVIAALILVTFEPSVPAKEQSDEGSSWEFSVAPYMWFDALMIGDYEALKKADIDSYITFEGIG